MVYAMIMLAFIVGALFGLIIGVCLSDAEDDVIIDRLVRENPECYELLMEFKRRKRDDQGKC